MKTAMKERTATNIHLTIIIPHSVASLQYPLLLWITDNGHNAKIQFRSE